MSAPNKNYDPKATASLAPDEVARVLDEAAAAVRHRAPLSLPSAEMGAPPPEARADAGRRVGAARSRLREALRERQVQLEAERDREGLLPAAGDLPLAGRPRPARAAA